MNFDNTSDSEDFLIQKQKVVCNFCGTEQKENESLRFFSKNEDSETFVCEECILLAFKSIMAEKLIESSSEESQEDGESKSRSSQKDNEQAHIISEGTKIEFTPIKIKNALDDYVIGQDHAKKMLSVAVYNHQKRIKYNASKNKDLEISKSNILIIGPTGSGKTLMANTIAKILNLPYASCDATAITETGYVGEDASVIIERLLQNSDGSVIRAQQGIGCIDEIDKIAKKSESLSGARDVSGEGVQQALLKILEGTISHVSSSGNKKSLNAETIPVNTEGILFVCCGAFSGLDKIIAKRLISNSIGFDAKIKNDKENLSNILRNVEAEDLIEFGLIPEFVSRLHTVCVLDELDESLLVKILVEPKNSIIKQYKKLFEIDGFNIQFTDEALFAIAVEAKKRKSGARALRSILDSLLYDLMFEMPSSKENQSIDDSQGEKKEINSSSLKNCDSKDDIDSEEENKEDNKEIIVIDEDFVKKKFAKNKNISSLS